MPPLPSPGQVIRVEFHMGIGATNPAGSRFFLSYTGSTPDESSLNALSSAVTTAWIARLGPHVHSGETLQSVISTDLSSASGAQGQDLTGGSGGESGTALEAAAAACLVHSINRRYRGGRPKIFLRAGVGADLTGTNEWSTTFQGTINTAWHNFVADILATTGYVFTLQDLVNVSWYEGFTVFMSPSGRARNIPTLRSAPVVDHVLDTKCSPKVGSQRRRLDL